MIASPRLRSRSMIVNSRSASCSESELVGSSKTMTRALETRARATSTSCWAPTPRLPTFASGRISGCSRRCKGLGHQLAVLAAPDQAGSHALLAEHDVGLDRQMGCQGELLVDHGDAAGPCIARTAGCMTVRPRGSSSPSRADTAPDSTLHQRALAGPVFADQGADFPRFNPQRDAVERPRGPERLGDVSHFE